LCNTLGKRLFIRVPLPAAMMTTSTAAMTVLWIGDPRRASRNYRRWRWRVAAAAILSAQAVDGRGARA
jgi:hypothetical protein